MSEANKNLDFMAELRSQIGGVSNSLDQLRPPAGVATGISTFDDFLLWRGLPKGDLTLLQGEPGARTTEVWLNTLIQIHKEKKRAAWIDADWESLHSPFSQSLQNKKAHWGQLMIVKVSKGRSRLFWILNEIIKSGLFETVGCHLQNLQLKNADLKKIKKLANLHRVALVIISHIRRLVIDPIYALVIECDHDFFTIRRALHRPTPFSVPENMIQSDLKSELQMNRGFLW